MTSGACPLFMRRAQLIDLTHNRFHYAYIVDNESTDMKSERL